MDLRLVGVVAVVLVVGGVAGAQLSGEGQMCTLKGCLCQEDGEMPCNSCEVIRPVWSVGVVGVAKTCGAREIITCRDGEQVDTRINVTGSCGYEVVSPGF